MLPHSLPENSILWSECRAWRPKCEQPGRISAMRLGAGNTMHHNESLWHNESLSIRIHGAAALYSLGFSQESLFRCLNQSKSRSFPSNGNSGGRGNFHKDSQGDESLSLIGGVNPVWKRLLWQSESPFHGQLNGATGNAIAIRNRYVMEVMEARRITQLGL